MGRDVARRSPEATDVTGRHVSSERTIAGRDEELARLHDALDRAAAGRGRTVLLGGEPGIGKTTLAQAFSAEARDAGARVVWGRCWEAGGAPPYWPWVQALREALALPGAADDIEAVRPFLDVVATLVPEVAGPGVPQRPAAVEGDHERFALFDAVSRVLQAAGRSSPLVVVLDDLHAADAASLLLLRFVARDIRTSKCLVIGTLREREVRQEPTANETLREVAREGDWLTLEGLDSAAIASMLQSAADVPPSDALMTALHDITQGNPLYANEIMRLLLREGQVQARLDLTRRGLPVPESVSDLVLKRVKSLDPQAQALLRAAAVIGREFSVGPLAKVAGISVDDARAVLATAEAERVIRSSGAGAYIFDHGLIRESLYESLADAERGHLHGRVGAALEEAGVDELGENLAEIAHHYLRAALTDVRPPFDYAIRAGRRALEVLAYEQAVAFLEEALGLASAARATDEERGELLLKLGESLLRAGRVVQGRERLVEAAEIGRRSGSSDLLARAAIVYGYAPVEGGVVNHVHVALVEEALDALGDEDSVERALLLSRLGHELMLSPDKRDGPRRDALTSDALAMIRRIGVVGRFEHEYAHILRSRFSAILGPTHIAELLEVADEILRIGLSARDYELQLMGRLRRSVVFFMQGRPADLDSQFEEALRLSRELRQPLYASPTGFFKACLTAVRADVETALKESDAALAIGSEVPNAMGAHLLQHVCLRWEVDGAGDLEFFMRAVMEQRPGIRRAWGAALANTLARTGRRAEAKTLVADTIEDLPNAAMDSSYMALLHGATDTLRVLREAEGAEVLYNALLPFGDQQIVQVMVAPVVYYGSAQRDLATLASLLGRWHDAEVHFERALRHHGRMGARTFLAWTQAELGEMLIRRGDTADQGHADDLLREARQSTEQLGLQILLDFIGGLARQTSKPLTPTTASMVREGEYVTIARGDEVVRLRASKGVTYLATLLRSPGRELHVLEIASPGAGAGSRSSEGLEVAGDDVGPRLDPKAKAAYKERIDELRAEIEEAEAFNDLARAARAREELDFILQELAGAVGLGGRDRKVASNVERARVNVTKRIKTTIEKIVQDAPSLGRHLEATVKTGTFLSYSDRLNEPTLEWDIRL